VRDARAEGAQERRARRNGKLAGRLALSLAVVIRFALATLLDALAFVVWDVGTRPPRRLLHDVVTGAREPARLRAGLIRFCIGFLLLVLAGLVARPALPTLRTYTVMETAMLIAALIVEQLVGDDLRGAVRKQTA
jgi:hypothetical protein